MDEQRVQAYVSLIQELLTCPSGEENDVLNRHQEQALPQILAILPS